jgi:hypothetical protein
VTLHVGLVIVMVTMVAALAPLASATPPDQTWIAGIYDNADFDDVVLLIASSVGLAAPPGPLESKASFPSVELAPRPDDWPGPRVNVAYEHTRAPPVS